MAFTSLLKSGLLRAQTPPEAVADALAWITSVIVIFVVSIPFALVTHWASMCWILFPLVRIGLRPAERRMANSLAEQATSQ